MQNLFKSVLVFSLLTSLYGTSALAASAPVLYESEPNNTPAEVNTFSGPATIMGSMEGIDQDGFMWSVSDVDAQHSWSFELTGIPDALTRVEFIRLTFTENGQEVAKREMLFSFSSRDGSHPILIDNLIFEPGDYLIGLARAGGMETSSGLLAAGDLNLETSSKISEGIPADVATDDAQAPLQAQYRLNVKMGRKLYAKSLTKNTHDKPLKLRAGSESAIYAEEPVTWSSLELSAKDSQQRWEISGRTAIGRTLNVFLRDGTGKKLAQAATDKSGKFSLPDLGLEKGKYLLELEGRDAGVIRTVSVKAIGQRIEGDEAEPNDRWEQANRVDMTKPVHGRAGKNNDYDYFRFRLPDEKAGHTRTFRLEGVPGMQYQVCLLNDRKETMQCRTAQTTVTLEDLSLIAGDYALQISRGKKGATYTLSMQPGAPRKPIQEAEPNDMFKFASGMNAKRIVKGRFSGADTDYYRFTVSGDPQLWRIQAMGDGISRVSLVDTAGRTIQQLDQPAGSRRARLSNLFLLPGTHHVLVTGKKGAYLLRVLPIGPPNPDLEREPNDHPSRAHVLRFGQTRIGLLENKADNDRYRFLLTNDDHIRLTIEPPVDGRIISKVGREHMSTRRHDSGVGQPIILEGLFPPGDYGVHLAAQVPSDAEYKIKLERLPRFSCSVGCDPPGSTIVADKPGELPVSIKLETKAGKIAAYRNYGQKLAGSLVIDNPGQRQIVVNLQVTTSDYRWRAKLEQMSVEIPAGSSVSVPLTLHIPRDAWADRPVRVSLRAYDTSGSQVEAYTEIIADAQSRPVDPVWDWPVPDEMLGGFNVAWKALGGRRVPFDNEKKEGDVPGVGRNFHLLFDNQAVLTKGLELKRHKTSVTVELAGKSPVEVVGIVLNPTGRWSIQKALGTFELQLSPDGKTFATVLTGKLQPTRTDQPFVLEKSTPARFARLILLSPQSGETNGEIILGEWKVIAKPGVDISNGRGFNIAKPELGGHVVWAKPKLSHDWDKVILTKKADSKRIRVMAWQPVEWVIGFHDERAARITRLEWVDSEKAEPEERIRQAKVYVALDSPLGPWELVADWGIDANPALVLGLEKSVWARYVKFSIEKPEKRQSIAVPETLRIFEQPADEQYRSVIGEWGVATREAIYEKLSGLKVALETEPSSGNKSKQKAKLLIVDRPEQGSVTLGRQPDWYKINIPEDQNTLELKLEGDPTVRTIVSLQDDSGTPVSMPLIETKHNRHTYQAIVDPENSYYIKVEEPPRSVVFVWDNSGSVMTSISMIYNAVSSYVSGVRPGIDVANLLVLGGDLLLKDWSGEPYVLQSTLNDYKRGDNSSAAERALARATEELAGRPGTKAIVIVTDAETSRYSEVWNSFDKVRPRIFTIRGSSSHGVAEDLMQSWAGVSNGYADNPLTSGEMDRAFDRAKTLLRQPAPYRLEALVTFEESPGPGILRVVAKEQGMNGGAVELILDASGSMLKRLDGKRRINIAKEVLSRAVTEIIPTGTPVALRVFGHKKPYACQTDLEIKLKPLDPIAAQKTISKINAKNLAKTPIADSLAKVAADLRKAKGKKIVILVTDGEETCGGDPTEVLKVLAEKGIDIRLNIVGFAIDDPELKRQFESWAEQGGGKYFDADDEASLHQSLNSALRTPYSVYNQAGEWVAEGTVGGDPLKLEAGFYRVKISGSSPKIFDKVKITGERERVIEF